ncbi:MAG: cytochrome c family protein [Sphingobium sp.]|nr:cytochrome c family protein [Sphingobium sp.]
MRQTALIGLVLLAGCSGQGTEQPESGQPTSFAVLKGDAARGKTLFSQCAACHSVTPGTDMIGPNLRGIVGTKAGDVAGYQFTAAMKNSGIIWSPQQLYEFLESPQAKVPGTKMPFGGIPDPQSRADIIAWLETQK